jgi:hypothetical protein
MKLLKGFTPYRKEDAEKYNRLRWWAGLKRSAGGKIEAERG